MSIIQATRNPAHWGRFSGDAINTGFPTGIDTNYAKVILRDNNGGVGWRHLAPVILADHWWQVEWYPGGFSGGTGSINMVWYDATGTALFRLTGGSTPTFQIQVAPGTWTTICTLPSLTSVWYTITVRLKVANSSGEISFWLNGTQIGGSWGGDTEVFNTGGVAYVDFSNPTIGSGANGTRYYGAVVVTTGDENPYGVKPAQLVLQSDGTYAEWGPGTNNYANVDDPNLVDYTDIINAALTGKRATFNISDPPSLVGSETIRGLYHTVAARGGQSGPTAYNHAVLASGLLQLSPTVPLTTGWKTHGYMFESNSVTSSEFTPSEVAGAEVGVVSA